MSADGKILIACAHAGRIQPYIEALRAAGVEAEAIASAYPGDAEAVAAVGNASGLILCGGEDIDPHRYGEDEIAGAGVDVDPSRDAYDWDLLTAARAARTPVFGVCRGLQVINVFLGGSLYQDLPRQRPGTIEHDQPEPRDLLAHPVTAHAGAAPFAELLARGTVDVNSRHHQGVKVLAPKLIKLATAPDGLIEAFALPTEEAWWLGAVQWHPENLIAHPVHRELWSEFAAAAAAAPAP